MTDKFSDRRGLMADRRSILGESAQADALSIETLPPNVASLLKKNPPLTSGRTRFHVVADNSPALIWTAGTDGLCNWFNKGWLEFTGRTMAQELGNGWTEGVHPQDFQLCVDQYLQHFKAHEEFLIEYRLRRSDGQYRWILDSGTPVFDTDGKFIGYNGVCFDIQERKESDSEQLNQAKTKEKKSEERMSLATQFAGIGIWDLDLKNNQLIWDNKMYELFDVRPDEFSNAADAWKTSVHPDDLAHSEDSLEVAIREGKNFDLDFRIVCKNREIRYLKGIGKAIYDDNGKPIRMLGANMDITESKTREGVLQSAKAELRMANKVLSVQNDAIKATQLAQQESEERLALAVKSTGVGVWDWNLQTMEMVWDESMFTLYCIKREDFSNAVDAWEKSLHPDDRQRAEHEIEEAINNIKPFDTEFRIIRSNGEIRDIEAVAKVFFSDDGTPLRMLGTNIDITERAIVERMKAEFVTTAAHELRTPLTIINGYTELLNMDVGSKDEQREMLSAIHSHSQAMIHLLNDMLDIAKIEAQAAGIYHMEPQQIGPRLQTLADTFITKSNRNKIALEISPNLPEVKVDVAKIEQAVMNCLSNAYKFSPKRGEVTMRVTEVTHDKQRKVLIAIEDQGIGMTPEQLERVFEKFYRADPSGAIPGTGLGMAIIKNIIEQHGGAIMIDSEYGKGTKVMLYLPVA
jgi:PAS domain S-box-containing protein